MMELYTDGNINIFAEIHHDIQTLIKQRRKVFVKPCNKLRRQPFLIAATTSTSHDQLESINVLKDTYIHHTHLFTQNIYLNIVN